MIIKTFEIQYMCVYKSRVCHRCGLEHGPSYKTGHYARCCKTKRITEVRWKTGETEQQSESSEEEFFIGTVSNNKDGLKRWLVELPVSGHDVNSKLILGLMYRLCR